jgi:hypothetical protein
MGAADQDGPADGSLDSPNRGGPAGLMDGARGCRAQCLPAADGAAEAPQPPAPPYLSPPRAGQLPTDGRRAEVRHLIATLKEAITFCRRLEGAMPAMRGLLASPHGDVVQDVISLLTFCRFGGVREEQLQGMREGGRREGPARSQCQSTARAGTHRPTPTAAAQPLTPRQALRRARRGRRAARHVAADLRAGGGRAARGGGRVGGTVPRAARRQEPGGGGAKGDNTGPRMEPGHAVGREERERGSLSGCQGGQPNPHVPRSPPARLTPRFSRFSCCWTR